MGIEIIARTPLTWQKMTSSSGLPCRSHGSLCAFLEAGAEVFLEQRGESHQGKATGRREGAGLRFLQQLFVFGGSWARVSVAPRPSK